MTESSTADRLLDRVLASGDGDALYALTAEFARGYPLEHLRRLLKHENPKVARAGAVIASELGEDSCALVAEFAELLAHTDPAVRYDILECTLLCATSAHGALIAKAIELIHDPDPSVRYRALRFWSCASPSQLKSGLGFIKSGELHKVVSWLSTEQPRDVIAAWLRSADPLQRRAAVAVVGRPRALDLGLLETASSSTDEDVLDFAQRELRIQRAIKKTRKEREEAAEAKRPKGRRRPARK